MSQTQVQTTGYTDLSVTTAKLANDAVTTSKIANNAVTAAKIANFTSSLAGNGWQDLPSGLIMQWGSFGNPGGVNNLTISFPKVFPNACYSIQITADINQLADAPSEGDAAIASGPSTTGFTAALRIGATNWTYYWFAIGK